VDESSGVADKSAAETIRAQREWECIQESVFGRKSTASFLEAAVSYMEGGGERRFLAPLIKYFGAQTLATIDQAAIDKTAKALCPDARPGTLNRQVYTPLSAVLNHAAVACASAGRLNGLRSRRGASDGWRPPKQTR
jgi:hypothetical protein